MKNKRMMNETQIEKKEQRDTDRLKQYQQSKRAEELANGMVLCNTALEQLGHKIKEEEIITVSGTVKNLKVKKLQHGLPNVLNRNNSIPHILCALYPSHSKLTRLSRWKSKRIAKSATEMCSSCALQSERSEPRNWPELAWATMLPAVQREGYSEERTGEAVREWWRSRHKRLMEGI